MTRDFITNEFTSEKISEEELNVIHKSIGHRHVAWLKALTYQLRVPKPWEHSTKKNVSMRKDADIHHKKNHF